MNRPKVIGYVRVSTERQADQGMSLEVQRTRIEQYCALYDMELVDIVVDAGLSATKMVTRPGLTSIRERVKRKEVQGIVVAKLDRLTRRLKDLSILLDEFEAKKVKLCSVAEQLDTLSPGGRLVINMLMTVAQWESEVVSARTKDVLAHKKTQGKLCRFAPYGQHSVDGVHLVAHEGEQATIARAKALHAEGKSLRVISAELEQEGHVSRGGKAFNATTVAKLVA